MSAPRVAKGAEAHPRISRRVETLSRDNLDNREAYKMLESQEGLKQMRIVPSDLARNVGVLESQEGLKLRTGRPSLRNQTALN